jgi:hypothetical protein
LTKNDSIVGIYPSRMAAEAAFKELQQSGFQYEETGGDVIKSTLK